MRNRRSNCTRNRDHPGRATRFRVVAAGPHLARTMPWGALAAGCGVGLAISLASYWLAHPFQEPVNLTLLTIRAEFVPPTAAVAFIVTDPCRRLTPALPAPIWLSTATHLIIAAPLLSLTAYAQVRLAAAQLNIDSLSQGQPVPRLPWASLSAEFAAWLAITLAVAAFVARTRWNDLGGAIAAPATLGVLALLAATPLHLLPASLIGPTASVRAAWFHSDWSWCTLGGLATFIACWASRDPWSRLRRRGLRLGEAGHNRSEASVRSKEQRIE